MENIPGTDRPGPGDMEMADIIGIEWNERLHTHYTLFSFPTKQVSKISRVGPYSINIQQMRFEFEELLSSNKEKKIHGKKVAGMSP